jgi:hypothetical protein
MEKQKTLTKFYSTAATSLITSTNPHVDLLHKIQSSKPKEMPEDLYMLRALEDLSHWAIRYNTRNGQYVAIMANGRAKKAREIPIGPYEKPIVVRLQQADFMDVNAMMWFMEGMYRQPAPENRTKAWFKGIYNGVVYFVWTEKGILPCLEVKGQYMSIPADILTTF